MRKRIEESRVWFIGSDKSELKAISRLLKAKKITVKYITEVLELAKLLDSQKPDIFIIDYVLKPVDGFKLSKILKRDSFYRDVPVILISSSRDLAFDAEAPDIILSSTTRENMGIKVLAAVTSVISEQKFPVDLWEEADKAREIDNEFTAERNLLRNNYETIFENELFGILELDKSRLILNTNLKSEELLRISGLKLIGRDLLEVLSFNNKKIKQGLETSFGNESLLVPYYNSILELTLLINHISTQQENRIVILHDVSERETLQKRLADYTDELEAEVEKRVEQLKLTNIELDRLNKLKSEYLSNVSHEIRTPLASIKGFVETLMNREVDEKTRIEFFEIIASESRRMEKIVNDILDITKVQQGQLTNKPDMKRFDIFKELTFVMNLLKPIAEDKKINLTLTPLNTKLQIRADKDRLRQVFVNILENAIKFSPLDSEVIIKVKKAQKKIIITFSDTGPGIPQSECERVFEKFYMMDGGDTRRAQGTGVGLYIASEIMKMHKGTIELDNKYKKGARFIIKMPLEE